LRRDSNKEQCTVLGIWELLLIVMIVIPATFAVGLLIRLYLERKE
jgi:hypothetical protein